jgi:hypothetical protein
MILHQRGKNSVQRIEPYPIITFHGIRRQAGAGGDL